MALPGDKKDKFAALLALDAPLCFSCFSRKNLGGHLQTAHQFTPRALTAS
jgi:hypothetical protein